MDEAPQIPAGVDTSRPTPVRIYDYMLQGNNYFQVDRFAAEQILKAVLTVYRMGFGVVSAMSEKIFSSSVIRMRRAVTK